MPHVGEGTIVPLSNLTLGNGKTCFFILILNKGGERGRAKVVSGRVPGQNLLPGIYLESLGGPWHGLASLEVPTPNAMSSVHTSKNPASPSHSNWWSFPEHRYPWSQDLGYILMLQYDQS